MLSKTKLDPDNPVTLTMWHVYGEQADSPMNRLIEEFNETIGLEKGIIIDVTMMLNASQIEQKLLDAQNDVPGVPSIPDLFFCHNKRRTTLLPLQRTRPLLTDLPLPATQPKCLQAENLEKTAKPHNAILVIEAESPIE